MQVSAMKRKFGPYARLEHNRNYKRSLELPRPRTSRSPVGLLCLRWWGVFVAVAAFTDAVTHWVSSETGWVVPKVSSAAGIGSDLSRIGCAPSSGRAGARSVSQLFDALESMVPLALARTRTPPWSKWSQRAAGGSGFALGSVGLKVSRGYEPQPAVFSAGSARCIILRC